MELEFASVDQPELRLGLSDDVRTLHCDSAGGGGVSGEEVSCCFEGYMICFQRSQKVDESVS